MPMSSIKKYSVCLWLPTSRRVVYNILSTHWRRQVVPAPRGGVLKRASKSHGPMLRRSEYEGASSTRIPRLDISPTILRRIVSRRSREVFWTVRKTMDLHLHLSVAFRALDKKWGKTIDLDSSAETLGLPCLPAVIERPTTTFSSEEFLRTRRIRATPYSRYQDIKRDNKTNDSFADISLSRIPLSETEATSVDSGLDQESTTVSRLVEELSTKSEAMSQLDSLHSDSLDSMLENRKSHALKHWKRTAKAFIEMRCKRIDSKKLTRH